jgi:hypothetical protein
MSKGLQYAFHLIDKNLCKTTDELINILKPYANEIKEIGGFSNVQMPKL